MAIEIKVPAAGESITSATIGRWHKPDGAAVRKGEAVVTLETDKVSHELEAEADGVLRIEVAEGEEVEIGTLIGRIDEADAAEAQEPAGAVPDADGGGREESAPQAESEAAAPASAGQASQEPVEVKVPPAGESITSATLAAWRKSDGDRVAKGETLVTIETDKVSSELEAEIGGVIRIKVSEGEEVPIGTVIALIEPQEVEASASDDATEPTEEKPVAEQPAVESAATKPQVAETPAEPKPDLAVVPEPAVEPAPATDPPSGGGRTTRRKMSPLRRKIATHLVNAQQTSAILTTFNEVDMSAVMKLRKEVQEDFVHKHGIKLGFMSFFLKAATQALRDVPQLNARIDGNDIIENHFYDIGVAVGLDKGLVVPVVRDVDQKGFARLERDILDYAQRARDGKIQLEDLQGGVFTISNGGVYGFLLSTPILNPPQSGILGMHTIQQRPVAVDGEVVIRPMMYLALSYDHRIIDGRDAVTFLIRIKECIESPARLLLEM